MGSTFHFSGGPGGNGLVWGIEFCHSSRPTAPAAITRECFRLFRVCLYLTGGAVVRGYCKVRAKARVRADGVQARIANGRDEIKRKRASPTKRHTTHASSQPETQNTRHTYNRRTNSMCNDIQTRYNNNADSRRLYKVVLCVMKYECYGVSACAHGWVLHCEAPPFKRGV